MTKIFMIYGSYGHPDENWFPWLKSKLEQLNCEVFIPKFPTPENQNLETWSKIFNNYENKLDEDCILIGHSTGTVFLLSVLEKLNKQIKACYLVSCFTSMPNNLEINKTFTDKNFDWDKIKQNAIYIKIYHSDNDPYINLKYPKIIAEHLNCELEIIKNAGHFNEKAGYTKFEKILEDIKLIL